MDYLAFFLKQYKNIFHFQNKLPSLNFLIYYLFDYRLYDLHMVFEKDLE